MKVLDLRFVRAITARRLAREDINHFLRCLALPFGDQIRGHWSIENRSHYVRDFTYDEDRSQVRTGNGPNSMASLRNFAISLLRLSGINTIASKLREIAARPHLAFKLIGV